MFVISNGSEISEQMKALMNDCLEFGQYWCCMTEPLTGKYSFRVMEAFGNLQDLHDNEYYLSFTQITEWELQELTESDRDRMIKKVKAEAKNVRAKIIEWLTWQQLNPDQNPKDFKSKLTSESPTIAS
jgi:hypothetical protein